MPLVFPRSFSSSLRLSSAFSSTGRLASRLINTSTASSATSNALKGVQESSYTFLPPQLFAARARLLPPSTSPSPPPEPLAIPAKARPPRSDLPASSPAPDRPPAQRSRRLPWTRPPRPRRAVTTAFAHDPAHRLPTLWGWYRDVLRECRKGAAGEREVIKRWVEGVVRSHRFAEEDEAAAVLEKGYKLLETLQAHPARVERLIVRLNARVTLRTFKAEIHARKYWKHTGGRIIGGNDTKGIPTGDIIMATPWNRPVPRLKPQPHNLGNMIARRKLKYQKALDVLELHRLTRAHPTEPLLRNVAETEDFRERVVRAKARLEAGKRMMHESPSPELAVRMLQCRVQRMEYRQRRAAKLARRAEEARKAARGDEGVPASEWVLERPAGGS